MSDKQNKQIINAIYSTKVKKVDIEYVDKLEKRIDELKSEIEFSNKILEIKKDMISNLQNENRLLKLRLSSYELLV